MADTSNEINKQNEMLDAQLSIVEALSRLAQQRVVFEGETSDEISNINDTLREQLNIANKQERRFTKKSFSTKGT
jgi:DNA helicase IV